MGKKFKGVSSADYRNNKSAGSQDISKLLLGALAGAAAGSLIAGLFTEKGIETRKRIGKSSSNIANNVKDKVSDITHGIADKFQATKESAADLIEKGKRKVGMSSEDASYEATTSAATSKGKGSKVLLSALAVSVGGTLLWSFTTQKGIETRKRLGNSSKNLASNLKDKVSGIADTVAEKYETAKEGAMDLLEKDQQKGNLTSGRTSYISSSGADSW